VAHTCQLKRKRGRNSSIMKDLATGLESLPGKGRKGKITPGSGEKNHPFNAIKFPYLGQGCQGRENVHQLEGKEEKGGDFWPGEKKKKKKLSSRVHGPKGGEKWPSL